MFLFKPTEQTYADPASATFLPGVPFGREFSKGDICFLHTEFVGSKMFFNSLILREAILNSKDYLEEVLQIKITDVKKEQVKEEPVEEPEPIVEEVPETEEPVVEEEAVVEETPTEEVEEVVEEPTEETIEEVVEETEPVEGAFETEAIEEPKKTNKKK